MTENWLQEEYTIDTPENVSFRYEIAGIGSRFLGGLIDSAIIGLALLLLNIVLAVVLEIVNVDDGVVAALGNGDVTWGGGIALAIYTLLNFVLIWGYYVLFELIWNGQTPGKRRAQLRVVRLNGNPAGFLDVVIRNLVRMVDFLPTAYGLGLTVMFFNRHARRLGDYAAGTIVVKDRQGIALENLDDTRRSAQAIYVTPEVQAQWQQRFPALRRLSATDYDLLRAALVRHDQGMITSDMLHRLAAALAHKLGALRPDPNWQASRIFLTDVAEAYRQLGS